YPGDHLLRVDQRGGEAGCREEAAVRADAHPALAGESVEQGACAESFAAEAEGSSMEGDERRCARRTGAMTIEGKQVSPTLRAVADVRDPLDRMAPEDRREQDADKGWSSAKPSGELGVHAVAPVGPEALAQGKLDRGACPKCPPTQHQEPGRRQDGET